MDFLHQNLQWTPANLAKVPIVIRKELLITAGAVDMNASPPQVAISLTEAAVANECRFRSHARRLEPRARNEKGGNRPDERPLDIAIAIDSTIPPTTGSKSNGRGRQ